MADNTPIEWTDATWNPVTGCTLVSEGCRHCYAARLAATRLQHHPSRKGLARLNAAGEAKFTGEVRFNPDVLDQPLRWRRPRMIFVCAHGDLFHESVPDDWIDQVFAVMALAPQHTFQVLTKRPERMRKYLEVKHTSYVRGHDMEMAAEQLGREWDRDQDVMRTRVFEALFHGPLPNVWLGTSIEDQPTADTRIPYLLQTPAAVRWISAEPLLGPVEWKRWLPTARKAVRPGGEPFLAPDYFMTKCEHCGWVGSSEFVNLARGWDDADCVCPSCERSFLCDEIPQLDWVVAGGESGPGARPMHPDWARSLRDQCAAAGVPFLFKQWGAWAPTGFMLRQADGSNCMPNVAWPDGTVRWGDEALCDGPGAQLANVGKGKAGRLLDGVQHDGFPVAGGRPGESRAPSRDDRPLSPQGEP